MSNKCGLCDSSDVIASPYWNELIGEYRMKIVCNNIDCIGNKFK
ncbi:MAG: hypothetical protein PF569_01925 [Candidatus Woesearchaeota archaeon]|nr:hypothetical protein [Candidatus Woesearchaeota archaeon]